MLTVSFVGLTRSESLSQHFNAIINRPDGESLAVAVFTTRLVYLFPDRSDDAHFAITCQWGWPSRVDQSIAFCRDVSNNRGAGPHFVPCEVDVMFNFFAIESVRTTIGAHRSVQVSALLISHCPDRYGLRPVVVGNERQKMPVFRIHDHTFGILPEGVHLFAGLNDLSRAIDESVRSAEVHGPLPYVENDDANPTCAGRLLADFVAKVD